MALNTTDRIVYQPARADADAAISGLARVTGRQVTASVADFLVALAFATDDGQIDYPFAVAHGANESNNYRDPGAIAENNFFGIGHPDNASGGIVFANVRECARFYVGELLLKLRRPIPPALADARAYAPAKWDQVESIVGGSMGTFPTVERISDLNKRFGPNNQEAVWMTDANGPAAIVEKGRAIFPNLIDQTTGGPTPMPIDINFRRADIGRGSAALQTNEPKITDHNTGNTVPASSELVFFKPLSAGGSEGGSQRVLVHFLVDEIEGIQITKLWKQGVHAGNAAGNQTSIAIEQCARREHFDVIERNCCKIHAMLISRDPRIDWEGAEGLTFTLEHIVDHQWWPNANPDCPQVSIERHGPPDGEINWMRDLTRQILAGVSPAPVPILGPHLVGHEKDGKGKTMIDADGNQWLWMFRNVRGAHPIQLYEYANVNSRKGPQIKSNTGFKQIWGVATNDLTDETPDQWGTTRLGWRFRISDLIR